MYSKICSIYGYHHVRVKYPGEKIQYHLSMIGEYSIDFWGETYNLCCPFCGDKRYRLYINHYWSMEPNVDSFRKFLVKCFNETDCMSNKNNRYYLWEQIESGIPDPTAPFYCTPIVSSPCPINVTNQNLPQGSIPISQLSPQHIANKWLENRNFDPVIISKKYNLHYVSWLPSFPSSIHGCLIVPVYHNSTLVGWQARNLSETSKLKYYNVPGQWRSSVLYNYDNAVSSDYVFVCEGVTDVWRFQEPAVALFGCHASIVQLDLLSEHWKNVYILLDADAIEKARYLSNLLQNRGINSKVLFLPSGDPADYTWDELYKLIKEQMS